MSFPPFPPSGGGRYSPSNAYNDSSTYTPSTGYRPNALYQTFDAYGIPAKGAEQSRSAYQPYEQPRRPFDNDTYDPYQPSQTSNGNAYDPGAPQIRLPPAPTLPIIPNMPNFPPRPPQPTLPVSHALPAPAPVRVPIRLMDGPSSAPQHLTVLTEPTTVHLAGQDIHIHALPPSHLPVTKYIATSREDAIEIHRRLCMGATSIWYADGSSRAGEGWSAAVEWLIDSSRSGSKMRECLGNADGLDVELGGIFKAAEGFLEALRQAIKDGKQHTQELIVFCDSQAAIVGIDTSSRAQAVKFDRLWREICSEFLQAEVKLAWLPKGFDIEGHVLADKIATVGASNSYLKRRKEGPLADIYKRPGGGEPTPPGSSEAGPWQRGDADPSRRKSPFERPKPLPVPIPMPPAAASPPVLRAPPPDLGLRLHTGPLVHPIPPRPADPVEEEAGQPREGSIFVTHFPDDASAKDIGILFGQYGNIVAVDIYHIAQGLPRFAFVAYTNNASGLSAIDDLHLRPINMSTDFARDNWADLEIWRQWAGRLTVVRSEPGRLVPRSVLPDFPDVPDWAVGGRRDETSPGRKRDRTPGHQSPNKRTRQESHDRSASLSHSQQPPHVNVKIEPGTHATNQLPSNSSAHNNQPLMPSFTPSHGAASASSPSSSSQTARSVVFPPTPITAEPNHQPQRSDTPSAGNATPIQGPASASNVAKRPLTNSASEPQEYPIKVGPKTIRAQIELVKRHFGKVHVSNWIAHSCFIASEIDQARRALQDDLYATDTGFLAGRELERTLSDRGFTPQRVDAFITKVLKVLDGIALAEADEDANGAQSEDEAEVEKELRHVLEAYPDQTKEAVDSAARLMEYLMRGKEAQEKKRLEVERRVKVLEGMAKIGEVVGGVVRYLLSDEK